jgi:uncharacterized membrane protein
LKIKVINGILLIDLLTILLVCSIAFSYSNVIRYILVLPFLLFFPGYMAVAAVKVGNENARWDWLEVLAYSLLQSLAICGLVGLALNFTPWGIRLTPVVGAISGIILVLSFVALARRMRAFGRINYFPLIAIPLPAAGKTRADKVSFVVMLVVAIPVLALLGWVMAGPKEGQKFTEFYMLDAAGGNNTYPTAFRLQNGAVAGVTLGQSGEVAASQAVLLINVVNHEYRTMDYSVSLTFDGQPATFEYQGEKTSQIADISLAQDEKKEFSIGIAPEHSGDTQKVQLLLYKQGDSQPYMELHFWVDVK